MARDFNPYFGLECKSSMATKIEDKIFIGKLNSRYI